MGQLISRQPILNQKKQIWAYMTLTHIDENNNPEDLQTLVQHYSQITRNQTVFINLEDNFFREETINTLGVENLGVSILTKPASKDNLLYICSKLKEKGFSLMMGDFVLNPGNEELLNLANFICINPFGIYSVSEKALLNKLKQGKIKLIAENISDYRKFNRALQEDYQYFRGDFYLQPDTSRKNEIPAYKLHYLNLLQEINQPEPDFDSIEKIIKNDISLSYNLFRLVNSAYFGLRHEVKSIRQALTLLGLNDYKKWISLKIMRGLAEDRPNVVVRESLIRAHFAENIAPLMDMKKQKLDLFLMGLFSLIDVLLGRPLAEVLDNLHLSEKAVEAILNNSGEMGKILKLIVSYNQGKWEQFKLLLSSLSLTDKDIVDAYFQAVNSANDVINALED